MKSKSGNKKFSLIVLVFVDIQKRGETVSKKSAIFALGCALAFSPGLNAHAFNLDGDWTVKTKYGDQVSHDKGLFGRNKTVLATRNGKVYEKKDGFFGVSSNRFEVKNAKVERNRGWFGTGNSHYQVPGASYKSKDGIFNRDSKKVNLLGNSVTRKKGLFGSHRTEVKTMFGDTITTRKGWFGRTTTEVEPGGLTGMFSNLFKLM